MVSGETVCKMLVSCMQYVPVTNATREMTPSPHEGALDSAGPNTDDGGALPSQYVSSITGVLATAVAAVEHADLGGRHGEAGRRQFVEN